MNMPRRLLLITGMSGSGKTTLAGFFEEEGYLVVTMGDVIRDLATEKGLPPTPENLGKIAREIRLSGGDAAVAERCIEKIKLLVNDVVVVDGIRSIGEVDVFRQYYDVSLVTVYASPKTRFFRLRNRGRSDDPHDMEMFRTRDERELGFSLGHAIALADFTIKNEGSLEGFKKKFQNLLSELGECRS